MGLFGWLKGDKSVEKQEVPKKQLNKEQTVYTNNKVKLNFLKL